MSSGALSTRYDAALLFAAQQHRSQLRKGSTVPYLAHLMSVSALVLEAGGSEDQAIAGLLHDVVEDAPDATGPSVLAEVRDRFGSAVADIVVACSDGLDRTGRRSGSWAQRKTGYVAELSRVPDDALLITVADKTHNARTMVADLRQRGLTLFDLFNGCRHQVLWYYDAVHAAVAGRRPELPLLAELDRVLDTLHALAGVPRRPVTAAPPEDTDCDCMADPGRPDVKV